MRIVAICFGAKANSLRDRRKFVICIAFCNATIRNEEKYEFCRYTSKTA